MSFKSKVQVQVFDTPQVVNCFKVESDAKSDFSLDLKVVTEVAKRTSTGNLFHSLGAADRNALEPIVEVTRGSTKR